MQSIPPSISKEIERNISDLFDKCGLYYRIFCRCKSGQSAAKKIQEKKYDEIGKKMQDLIGVRIALYFKDDIDVCVEILKNNYTVIETVRDEENSDKFSPMRLNLVCQMPESVSTALSSNLWEFPIDTTFEIQVRTIFSEGWHEVEHDLRYKNKSDWSDHMDLSRNLNGILATLETCDWAIINVLDQLAYQKYKKQEWSSMMRNHLRMHLENVPLSDQIIDAFNRDHNLAKEFFRVDRKAILLLLSSNKMFVLPKRLDNIIYFANEFMIKDPKISDLTPQLLRSRLESAFSSMST
ncbi:(p)ppGpp synthetase [Subdoligranulum variabile]|uniref:GTP pyrophosphokinase n=1 Tax=Subdoligranulum variabile TaxID=214851 RepID=UPI00294308F7|nr:(p)ppGpp synthetase [Subdoligranulum variabile]